MKTTKSNPTKRTKSPKPHPQQQELDALRAKFFQLKHQCGTDDIDVISAAVRRIKKITCVRCSTTVEAIAVGDKHHITENHVCEIVQPKSFTLRLG